MPEDGLREDKNSNDAWPPPPLVDASTGQKSVEGEIRKPEAIIFKAILWTLCGLGSGFLLPIGLLLLNAPIGFVSHGHPWLHYLSFPLELYAGKYLFGKNRSAAISFGLASAGTSLVVVVVVYAVRNFDIN